MIILFPLLGKRVKGSTDLEIGLTWPKKTQRDTDIQSGFQRKRERTGVGKPYFKQESAFQPHPGPSSTPGSGLCPYLWASPWMALPRARPTGPSGRPPQRAHGARTSSGSPGRVVEGNTPAHRGSQSYTPDLQ